MRFPFFVPALLFLLSGFHASADDAGKIFPDDAVINVTKPPYNAIPDDERDDTAALQRAISENLGTGRVLYLPNGVYNISDTLACRDAKGFWKPRITLQGQSRGHTVLFLAHHAPGFGDSAQPKAVYMSGSLWEKGDSGKGGGNKAFSNNVFNLTIIVGKDNPGAIGIEWANSNQGTIGDVTVTSVDKQGVAGISARREIPGPGLIRNCTVSGFQTGIDIGDIQYGFTLEHIYLQGQTVAGLRVSDNLVSVRDLTSDNQVPAVQVTGYAGALTMTDSSLSALPSAGYAIECAGTLYLQNIQFHGYGKVPVKTRDGEHAVPPPGELAVPPVLGTPGAKSLHPERIKELLPFWNADLADWEPVGDRREGESDDTQAIQRALDSGKSTIYFRNTRVYYMSDTLVIRGKVRQLLGMGSELNLGAAREPFSDREHSRPLIRIDPVEGPEVSIENFLFNAQYPGEVVFENNSPKPLAVRHCLGWIGAEGLCRSYRNTPTATGEVYLEDVFMPGWEFRGQSVWARQFNPENQSGDGIIPQVLNENGFLWILGFKTEGTAPFITTRGAKARTLLLGAYNYVSAATPNPLPKTTNPYIVEDGAQADLGFITENFREGDDDYSIYLKNGDLLLEPTDLPPRWNGVNPKSHAVSLWRAR